MICDRKVIDFIRRCKLAEVHYLVDKNGSQSMVKILKSNNYILLFFLNKYALLLKIPLNYINLQIDTREGGESRVIAQVIKIALPIYPGTVSYKFLKIILIKILNNFLRILYQNLICLCREIQRKIKKIQEINFNFLVTYM